MIGASDSGSLSLYVTCLVFSVAAASDLAIYSRPSDVEEGGFYVRAKTKDLVVRLGDTVDLACKTSLDWHLCGFTQPNGETCNRLSEETYQTGCKRNGRISYKVTWWTSFKNIHT